MSEWTLKLVRRFRALATEESVNIPLAHIRELEQRWEWIMNEENPVEVLMKHRFEGNVVEELKERQLLDSDEEILLPGRLGSCVVCVKRDVEGMLARTVRTGALAWTAPEDYEEEPCPVREDRVHLGPVYLIHPYPIEEVL